MPAQEESRANVVINQKMMKVIVSGIPQSVRLGVAMIEDVITFGRSAEHTGGLGHHPNLIDFPGSVAFGGMDYVCMQLASGGILTATHARGILLHVTMEHGVCVCRKWK